MATVYLSQIVLEAGYYEVKQAQVAAEMVEVGFFYPNPIYSDISSLSAAPVEVGYGLQKQVHLSSTVVEVGYGLQKQVHLSSTVIEVGYLGAAYGWQIGPRLQLEGG